MPCVLNDDLHCPKFDDVISILDALEGFRIFIGENFFLKNGKISFAHENLGSNKNINKKSRNRDLFVIANTCFYLSVHFVYSIELNFMD